MNYKIATPKEIEHIYETFMKKDFPPLELKPLGAIIHSVKRGWYNVFIAYDENEIKGYACIADCGNSIGFLDYFAIVKECRGTGVGTEFFKELDKLTNFDCILLETESIESAKNDEEDFIRKRRIAFYKRSGCIDTGCMYNVFGVEYNILINKEKELTPEFIATLLSAYEYAYAAILRRDDKDYIYRVK
ncbi:MAG: GNAT family N-acetyltransferase [Clostridia bacterium]